MTVEINIYQTEKLTDANDRIPEETVKKYLEKAFDRGDLDHDITVGFDPIDTDTEKTVCASDSVIREFGPMVKDEEIESVAKDSNVLITESGGGGCGWVGGNVCVTPGKHITAEIPHMWSGRGKTHSNIHANLHEVGHNLGAKHDHDDQVDGAQHLGMGWNEDPPELFGVPLDFLPYFSGTWHRTPNVAGSGAENECGEMVPDKEYETTVNEQYYADCAIESFEIVDES